MSWYVHPSKQLRDDELPPELVVTNRDGSVEQVYVPYNASDQLEAENAKLRDNLDLALDSKRIAERRVTELLDENAKLRELVRDALTTISWCTIDCCPSDNKKRELNARACELGIELNDYE